MCVWNGMEGLAFDCVLMNLSSCRNHNDEVALALLFSADSIIFCKNSKQPDFYHS